MDAGNECTIEMSLSKMYTLRQLIILFMTCTLAFGVSLDEFKTQDPRDKFCDLALAQCQEALTTNETELFRRDCYIFNDLVMLRKEVKACARVCSSSLPGDQRMCKDPRHCPDFVLAGVYCDELTSTVEVKVTVVAQTNATARSSTHTASSSAHEMTKSLATSPPNKALEPWIKNKSNIMIIIISVLVFILVAAISALIGVLIKYHFCKRDKLQYNSVSLKDTGRSDTEKSNV